MARLVIENPTPHKGGRVIHDADGVAQEACDMLKEQDI